MNNKLRMELEVRNVYFIDVVVFNLFWYTFYQMLIT